MKASDGQASVLISLHGIKILHKREIFASAAFCASSLSISTSCLHSFRGRQVDIYGHVIVNAYGHYQTSDQRRMRTRGVKYVLDQVLLAIRLAWCSLVGFYCTKHAATH
jgi:hypothetical protein